MKIILLENIKNLGKKYDIKNVSDGYARNFLIPKKLAEPATPENLQKIEKIKDILSQKNEEIKILTNQLKEKLKDIELEFNVSVGEKQQMFNSISEKDIKEKIFEKLTLDKKSKEMIDHSEIILEKSIKKLGEYQVEINLGNEIKTNLKISVKSLAELNQ